MPRGNAGPETMVRVYHYPDEFSRDATKLARQGWQVVNTLHRQPRAGCGRILTLGLLTLVRPPRPEIVVTYQRMTAEQVTLPAIASGHAAQNIAAIAPEEIYHRGFPWKKLLIIVGILIIIMLVVQ